MIRFIVKNVYTPPIENSIPSVDYKTFTDVGEMEQYLLIREEYTTKNVVGCEIVERLKENK